MATRAALRGHAIEVSVALLGRCTSLVLVLASAVSVTACGYHREVYPTPWFKETVTHAERHGIFHFGPEADVVYSVRVGKGWWKGWVKVGENPFGTAAHVLEDGRAMVFTTKLPPSDDRSIGPGGTAIGFEFELISEGEPHPHPVGRDFPCSSQGIYSFPPDGSRIDCAVCIEKRPLATFPTPRAGGGFELGTIEGCAKVELRRAGLTGSPVLTDVAALEDEGGCAFSLLPRPLYDDTGAPYFPGNCRGDRPWCLLVPVGGEAILAPKRPYDSCDHDFWAPRIRLAPLEPVKSLFDGLY